MQIKPYSLDSKKQMTLTVSPNSKIVKVHHGNNPVLKVISPGKLVKSIVKGKLVHTLMLIRYWTEESSREFGQERR